MRITLLTIFTLALVGGLIWYFKPNTAYQQNNAILNAGKDNTEKNMEKNTEQYQIDTEQSTVEWYSKKILVKTEHTGTVKIESGFIYFDPENLKISGEITVDMNTITDLDLPENMRQTLEKHLKSADFFEVETYPTAKISLIGIEKTEEENKYLIRGLLTIKETTNEISFPANISKEGDILKGEASLEFDRSLWNIRFGSGKFFENLGDKIIDDIIKLKIKIITL